MRTVSLETRDSAPSQPASRRSRVAVYGGSFDPIHNGHLRIATALLKQFDLDEFVFIPAFHAPHKARLTPTSAYDRYAMLCLVTQTQPKVSVSKMEIELPEKPFTVETLSRLRYERPKDDLFFVMGADSWMDIKTWREWEKVLTLTNHIVATRPEFRLHSEHVPDDIRTKIVDLRAKSLDPAVASNESFNDDDSDRIYFTDVVNIDISATTIRKNIRLNDLSWRNDVPIEVANYIEKYQIYI